MGDAYPSDFCNSVSHAMKQVLLFNASEEKMARVIAHSDKTVQTWDSSPQLAESKTQIRSPNSPKSVVFTLIVHWVFKPWARSSHMHNNQVNQNIQGWEAGEPMTLTHSFISQGSLEEQTLIG